MTFDQHRPARVVPEQARAANRRWCRLPGVRTAGVLLLLAVMAAAGCRREVRLTEEPPVEVDFSGSWELNYRLSERVQENYEMLYLMARSAIRRSNGYMDQRWLLPSLELVELAESISRSTVLEIEHGADRIEIARGEEFPLTCEFDAPGFDLDALGAESCGWDHHQLVFAFRLPDGLRVSHRLTLGPDGDRLNVATTVDTGGRGRSFTLNRVYTRFEPLPDEFECRLMVTGEKSCRRARPSDPSSSSP